MTSDKVGIHREIQGAGMGWVLKRNTIDWAGQLRELINDSSLLTRVMMHSNEWVKLNFSVNNTARDIKLLCYQNLITSR